MSIAQVVENASLDEIGPLEPLPLRPGFQAQWLPVGKNRSFVDFELQFAERDQAAEAERRRRAFRTDPFFMRRDEEDRQARENHLLLSMSGMRRIIANHELNAPVFFANNRPSSRRMVGLRRQMRLENARGPSAKSMSVEELKLSPVYRRIADAFDNPRLLRKLLVMPGIPVSVRTVVKNRIDTLEPPQDDLKVIDQLTQMAQQARPVLQPEKKTAVKETTPTGVYVLWAASVAAGDTPAPKPARQNFAEMKVQQAQALTTAAVVKVAAVAVAPAFLAAAVLSPAAAMIGAPRAAAAPAAPAA